MAKRSTKGGTLAGKAVAFVGKFGYRDMFLDNYRTFVVAAGGSVVAAGSAVPDYLVAGEGRGGKPPAVVAQLSKKHPTIQILDEAEFCRLLLPLREEFATDLRSGPREHQYWDRLVALFRRANTTIDLDGADLRNANLYGAKLTSVGLDGADLRGASAHYAEFGDLKDARFDGADLSDAYFHDAEGCTFRKAVMSETWLGFGDADGYTRCDFTGAKMAKVSGESCRFVGSVFEGADLSDGALEESDFSGVNLAGADLTRPLFAGPVRRREPGAGRPVPRRFAERLPRRCGSPAGRPARSDPERGGPHRGANRRGGLRRGGADGDEDRQRRFLPREELSAAGRAQSRARSSASWPRPPAARNSSSPAPRWNSARGSTRS